MRRTLLVLLLAACGAPPAPLHNTTVREPDEPREDACTDVARHIGDLERGEGVDETHVDEAALARGCRTWSLAQLACAVQPTAEGLIACVDAYAPTTLRMVRLEIKVARLKAQVRHARPRFLHHAASL